MSDDIDRWLRDGSAAQEDATEQHELGDVIATDLLWSRQARPPRLQLEVEALIEIGRLMAVRDRRSILPRITTYARELCKAESAGFSILEKKEDGTEVFRWTATTGRMETFEGGTTPANFSPCGACLERNSSQLFRHPERLYKYLLPIAPIAELLLIPMHADHEWVGTIWVICHGKRRLFDREDARLMMDLGRLAVAALSPEAVHTPGTKP